MVSAKSLIERQVSYTLRVPGGSKGGAPRGDLVVVDPRDGAKINSVASLLRKARGLTLTPTYSVAVLLRTARTTPKPPSPAEDMRSRRFLHVISAS